MDNNILEFRTKGSKSPMIAFCLTIKKEFSDSEVKRVMKFIKEFQLRSPIFYNEEGDRVKMSCETIIRTDIPRSEWRYKFQEDPNTASGIDDFFIYDSLYAPLVATRSPVQVTLLGDINSDLDLGVPRDLSWAMAEMLKENKIILNHLSWQMIMNIDYDTKQRFGLLETLINTTLNSSNGSNSTLTSQNA